MGKKPFKVLTRLDELQLLSTLSEAGLLSKAEEAGLFSKLEGAGAFSTVEGLLPLVQKLKVLTVTENLINTDASVLTLGAAALLLGEVGLIPWCHTTAACSS